MNIYCSRCGGLSFDQHCLVGNKKLSFDTPEFLDEYALTLKKKFQEGLALADQSESEDECNIHKGECVISEETLNLNKRNSEHSVKLNLDEKRSILKCSDLKNDFTNVEKLKMNNSIPVNDNWGEDILKKEEELVCPNNTRENSIRNNCKEKDNIKIAEGVNSILVQNNEISEDIEPKNNNRSFLSRFRCFTEKFGLSTEREFKVKTPKTKNNNCSKSSPHKGEHTKNFCC